MDDKRETFLLTNDPETEKAVAAALEKTDFFLKGVYSDLAQFVNSQETAQPPVALVDGDFQAQGILDELVPIINRNVHTRFVVLVETWSSDLMLKAMQVGVRHIQVKKGIATELAAALDRLVFNGHDNRAGGAAITILSAGGGCGATTIAVNLGNELQLANSKSVLLVDLDYSYGAIANYLGLRSEYSVEDLLARPDGIDRHLILTASVRYSDNLHALLSPASVRPGEPGAVLVPDRVSFMLKACKDAYAYTIIDAPRVSLHVAALLARSSFATWIVFQPVVKDIRVAKAMHAALVQNGAPSGQIGLVASRFNKRNQMLGPEDIQKTFGGTPFKRVSNDYESAVRAINYGKPLADVARRSALRRELLELGAQPSSNSVFNLSKVMT